MNRNCFMKFHDKIKKLPLILVGAAIFSICNFLSAGILALIIHILKQGYSRPPEMFGWSGAFLLTGYCSWLLSLGAMTTAGTCQFIFYGSLKKIAAYSIIFGTAIGFSSVLLWYFSHWDQNNFIIMLVIELLLAIEFILVFPLVTRIMKLL